MKAERRRVIIEEEVVKPARSLIRASRERMAALSRVMAEVVAMGLREDNPGV